MSITKEFKEFIMRGNVIDMAVGVVIGGAFSSVVNSVVNDILMPVVGVLTAGVDFAMLGTELKPAVLSETGDVLKEAVVLKYGSLMQAIINFILIAAFIFLLVKGMNKLRRKQEAEPAAEAEPSEDIVLLTEIRDLLKSNDEQTKTL